MKTTTSAGAYCLICTVLNCTVVLGVVAETHAANPLHPGKSAVRQVLLLETQEDAVSVDRRDALKPSMNSDPAANAQWWQSGYVKIGESWQPVEKSFGGATANLEEYRLLRAATPKTAAGQLKLANWCRSNKLVDQERAHLTQVLTLSESNPDRTLIFKRMGFRQLGENWVSPAEYQGLLKQSRQIAEHLRQWQPELQRITRNWGANARQHKLAQDELNAINDPTAIPALLVASRINDSLALAICDRLESIPSFESSQALATIAVESEWLSVRQAATKKLKDRRIDDFAPALLGALHTIYTTLKSAKIDLGERLIFREDETRYVATDLRFTPAAFDAFGIYSRRLGRFNFMSNPMSPRSTNDVARVIEEADYVLQNRIDDENDRTEEFNKRAATVLAEVSGQQFCADPKFWWTWWHLYTGTQPLPKKCTIYHSNVPLPVTVRRVICCSCLIAGTPVFTDRGFVAIEQIDIGDRVLAKDVTTGEIAFKPVLHTTVRQPVPVKKFVVGETSVVASEGHHFWVSGHGWSKTRELKSGQPIHTVIGMSRVETVEDELQPAAVYNLVVADFHTYFVGPSLILSHDVLQPALTNSKVPGLDAE